jgi:glycosyltransferase involved in cell wall biosynthesis
LATDDPRVSVIVPAYNSADYTVETVESILAQTYRDFELIVVDDGSTDHTREAMGAFGHRIQYAYKENGGACSARNFGIARARGEYIACLDCDDLWLPEKLERSVAALDEHLDWALVFSPSFLIDAQGGVIGCSNYRPDLGQAFRELLKGNFIVAATVVMRRSHMLEVGPFDESIFIPADWDLWLRLVRKHPIGCIDMPLSKYRMTSSYTLRHVDQFIEESMYTLDKHLDSAPELSVSERGEILARMYTVHATLLRDKPDMVKAKLALKKAIDCDPSNFVAYGHFLLALCGGGVWRFVDKVKDRLGMGWLKSI